MIPFYAGGIVLVCALAYFTIHGQFNLLVAFCLMGALLLVLFLWSREVALLTTQAYLFLLGDIRRIFDVWIGFPSLDLLLLVGPFFVLLLALPLLLRLRVQDPLSKAMLFLTIIMFLEIFNPKQGGLTVGFAGVMFYLIPVFWFWIGRAYGSTPVVENLVYRVMFPLGIVAGILGICQTYVGFLPWERAWADIVAKQGYIITLGNQTRAFGFSVSVSEFVTFVAMANVGCLGAGIAGRRAWLLAVPLLLTAMFLGSSRGSVFKTVIAIAILWTLRKARKLGTIDLIRLGVFGAIGMAAVIFTASKFADAGSGSNQQALISHQVGGLAHPLDSRYSTAQVHNQIVLAGLEAGISYPIGRGLGSTTSAASKLGVAAEVQNSEMDFSDLFIALGLPGGLVYLFCIFTTLRYLLEYIRFVPRHIGLPILAILMFMLGNWLIAGQYSISGTLFFLVGCVTHERLRRTSVVPRPRRATPRQLTPALQPAQG